MLIEIKDIPKGRAVKKITFDIEFVSDEMDQKSESFSRVDFDGPHVPEDYPTQSTFTESTSESTPENPPERNVSEDRDPVDVPDEMKDLEF